MNINKVTVTNIAKVVAVVSGVLLLGVSDFHGNGIFILLGMFAVLGVSSLIWFLSSFRVPMTNRDRLINMLENEEFDEFTSEYISYCDCTDCIEKVNCAECIKRWLESEVDFEAK